jgi:hypothetical protein
MQSILVIWCWGLGRGAGLLELAKDTFLLWGRVWGLVDELSCLEWGPLVPIMNVSMISIREL